MNVKRPAKRHKPPLHRLASAFEGLDPAHTEKILAMARNPAMVGKLPFRIHIVEDRETSKEEATGVNEKVKVYPGGSAMYGQVLQ